MSKKKIPFNDYFLTDLAEAVEREIALVGSPSRQTSAALQKFIKTTLKSLDQELYADVKDLWGGNWPGERTIRRIQKEGRATQNLLEVCGYYIFGEKWQAERLYYLREYWVDETTGKIEYLEERQTIKDETRDKLFGLFNAHSRVEDLQSRSGGAEKEAEKKMADELFYLSETYIKSINRVDRISAYRLKGKTDVKLAEADRFVYILLDKVYVNRRVESKILEVLQAAEQQERGGLLLVEGEAGRGKTSLLWHWHRYFNAEKNTEDEEAKAAFSPLYLQALDLKGTLRPNLLDELLQVQNYVKDAGRNLLLLIDTLDLLIQEQDGQGQLLLAIEKWRNAGITILCTSRIIEARMIAPRLEDLHRFTLEDYNRPELEVAIRRHTLQYAFRYADMEMERESQRILSLVDRGLSLLQVCSNPLTFRMLYSIYLPNQIPENINTHILYNSFWQRKIERDHRPGIDEAEEMNEENWSLSRRRDEFDLSRLIYSFALLLLREGQIEMERSRVLLILEQKGLDKSLLAYALNRAILKESDERSAKSRLSFFHQTFFEYAAAKAFNRLGKTAFDTFRQRINQQSNKLFLLPIFEQLLLLTQTSLYADEIANEVARLLDSSAVAEHYSAIYVYTFLSNTSPRFSQTFIWGLRHKQHGIERYFELIPNTLYSRLESLFFELTELYPYTKNLKIGVLYFDALHRFVTLAPEQVFQFLQQINIADLIYLETTKGNRLELHAKTVACLLRHEFTWAFAHLLDLIKRFPKQTQTHKKILDQLLAFFQEEPSALTALAPKISQEVGFVYAKRSKRPLEIIQVMAQIWRLYWQGTNAAAPAFAACWTQLDHEEIFAMECQLYALAELTFYLEEAEQLKPFLEHYYGFDNRQKVLWMRAYLHNVFKKESILTTAAGPVLIEFVQQIIESHIYGRDPEEEFRKFHTCLDIKRSLLADAVVFQIFSLPILQSKDLWLDEWLQLWPTLFYTYKAKCPGARLAMEWVLDGRSEEYPQVLKKFRGAFNDEAFGDEELLEDALSMVVRYEVLPYRLSRLIEGADLELLATPAFLTGMVKRYRKWMQSLKSKEREEGLDIWKILIDKGLMAPPEYYELLDLYHNEKQEACQNKLILMMVTYGLENDFEERRRFMQELVTPLEEGEEKYIDAYIGLLVSNKAYAVEHAEEIVTLLLTPSRDPEWLEQRLRIRKISTLVKYVLERQPERAVGLFLRFLGKIDKEEMDGTRFNQKLAKNLYYTISSLAPHYQENDLERLLKFTKHLPSKLALDILEILYTRNLLSPRLKSLAKELPSSPFYPPLLTDYINRQEYIFSRISGTEKWPALDDFLAQL